VINGVIRINPPLALDSEFLFLAFYNISSYDLEDTDLYVVVPISNGLDLNHSIYYSPAYF